MTGLAIVGCGYVADQYIASARRYSDIVLAGVFDKDESRKRRFAAFHGLGAYDSLAGLLDDDNIRIVLNLTNPRSHFEISESCLRAGKHVYSEKPLAMELEQARALVSLAETRGLWISSAPCTLLGETAQTIWRALREKRIGKVRLVYAELDDGLVHRMPYRTWTSASGAPWPYKDEFQIGCTLEHAGYYLTWLAAFFGPATAMTAWASVQVPDKLADGAVDAAAPDTSVACIEFESGVAARLTCSIVAPHDHRLRIVGDDGVLTTKDCWMFQSPVGIRRPVQIGRHHFHLPWGKRYPLLRGVGAKIPRRGSAQVDWCRGVVDLAAAIREGRKPRLAPDFCLHVTELALGIHNAGQKPGVVPITTTFSPIEPMEWAR